MNIMPVQSPGLRVTSRFGMRTLTLQGNTQTRMHNGIDLTGNPNNRNEPIICIADGVVIGVRREGSQWGPMCFIRIRHDNGIESVYMHQQTRTITQSVGDRVKAGDRLGIIGTTGQSSGVHLHFQIDRGSNATSFDPWEYLFNGASLFDQSAMTANPQTPTPSAPPVQGGSLTYVVRQGDNLSRIARAHNTTVAVLQQLNDIPDANRIRIGQIIKLPDTIQQVVVPAEPLRSIDDVAREVIRGRWGNGSERRDRLTAAGYDPTVIQARVNELMA